MGDITSSALIYQIFLTERNNTIMKNIIKELGIKRAIIIDDGYKILEGDYAYIERLQALNDSFNEYKKETKLGIKKRELLDFGFTDEEIEDILQDEYEINDRNIKKDNNQKIIDFLTNAGRFVKNEKNKDIILVKLEEFIKNQLEIDDVITYYNIGHVLDICKYDLLIVDYDLQENVTGDEILGQIRALLESKHPKIKEDENEIFKIDEIYHVVFMSSKSEFELPGTTYSLIKPLKKNEYFRELRKKYGFYQCVVFNYIQKKLISDNSEEKIQLIFQDILSEFKLTRMFFDFLNSLYKQISLSKSEVFKDFYSLNLKTIKSVIDEEIQQEGVAEFKFFNDLICNLISKQNTGLELIKEINNIVDNIKNLNELTDEPYLDMGLVDIRKKEIYEDVSHTYAPIDFGDIFKFDFSDCPQHILVISQQCDLAIRRNGKRNCKNAILLRDSESNSCGIEVDRYELSDDERDTKKYCWDKVNPLTLPCEILDLTTLNNDGSSKLYLEADIEQITKNLITEGHRQYMKEIYKVLLDKINENEKAIEGVDESIKNKCRIININENYVRYVINDEKREADFGIKRIHRLDMKVTYKVQQEYTNVLNRIGQNLDIASLYKEKKCNIYLNGKKCTNSTVNLMLIKNKSRRDHILVDYHDLVNEINAISKVYGFYDFNELLTKLEHFTVTSIFNIFSKKNEFIKLTVSHLAELKRYGVIIDISGESIEIVYNVMRNISFNGTQLIHGKDFIVKHDRHMLFLNTDIFKNSGIEIDLKLYNPDSIFVLKGVSFINILDKKFLRLISFHTYENSLRIEFNKKAE